MKIAKNILCVIMIVIMLALAGYGAYSIYNDIVNHKLDKPIVDNDGNTTPPPTQEVDEAITLTSEKYGTFVVPKNAQIQTSFDNFGFFYQNNTDFSLYITEWFDKNVSLFGDRFQNVEDLGIAFFAYKDSGNSSSSKSYIENINKTFKTSTVAQSASSQYSNDMVFFFEDNVLRFDGAFGDFEFITDYVRLPLVIFDKTSLIDNESYTCKKEIKTAIFTFLDTFVVEQKFLKVDLSGEGIEGAMLETYVPVVINSDKGYPLTAEIYKELLAEQENK